MTDWDREYKRLNRAASRRLAEIRRKERAKEEQAAQKIDRMYSAARQSRLNADWQAGTSSADSEIRSSLTNLRARSRSLGRDSAYAKRAKMIVVNNVVGQGIGIQGQVKTAGGKLNHRVNDAIEDEWDAWADAESCHTGGELHFSDLERTILSEVFEAGEAFVRLHFNRFGRSDIPFALELIESERVPHGIQPAAEASGMVRMGIEVDRFYRPLRYWIRDSHPSDIAFTGDPSSERIRPIPSSQIIHIRIIERWPQTRAVPWLHAVAGKLRDMDGYSEAEIVAARGAANYIGSIERMEGSGLPFGEPQKDGSYQTEISPGILIRPPPGEKFNFHSPNRPNTALDPFMRYMLREVAAGSGVSYEALSRDYSQSNYSSSRLSLLDDRDLWKVLQKWFVRTFRTRVHRAWLQQAVLARVIPGISVEEYAFRPHKFEAVKFKLRGWGWVDPTKEVAAFKEAERAGYLTKTKIISMTAHGDEDIEDTFTEREEELALARDKGLTFDTDQVLESTVAEIDGEQDGEAAEVQPTSDVQQTALNGAQIASLVQILEQVTNKLLSPQSAKAAIKSSFPTLSDALVNEMVDNAESFTPAPQEQQSERLMRAIK